jgi:hypothetical protein
VSLLVNAEMYRHAPQTIAAFRDVEIIGLGWTNSERQGDLTKAEERALIAETTEVIEKHSRKRPQGWLGPWPGHGHCVARLHRRMAAPFQASCARSNTSPIARGMAQHCHARGGPAIRHGALKCHGLAR